MEDPPAYSLSNAERIYVGLCTALVYAESWAGGPPGTWPNVSDDSGGACPPLGSSPPRTARTGRTLAPSSQRVQGLLPLSCFHLPSTVFYPFDLIQESVQKINKNKY